MIKQIINHRFMYIRPVKKTADRRRSSALAKKFDIVLGADRENRLWLNLMHQRGLSGVLRN